MKQLLLVEDDALLNKTLCYNLMADGFAVFSAASVKTAAARLAERTYDLVLLDVGLPDGNGYDICRALKARSPATPVIFITANDCEGDELRGYEAGAVDYITKPFSVLALQRKIRAIFWMLESNTPPQDVFDDGVLMLNFSSQTAALNGKPVALSAMEFKVLCLFHQNEKRVLTRAQLLERLWDADEKFVDEHTLTTTISRIRAKIEAEGACYIKTVYGMGYLWTGGARA